MITDDIKNCLISNPWKPDLHYKFPRSGPRNLSFQFKWFSNWDWLVYSPSQDGAFCKFCSLFSTVVGVQSVKGGKLVNLPYKDWKHAKDDFQKHELLQYHSQCKERAMNFISTYSGSKPSIDISLNKGIQTQIAENRNRLKPIIKTVMFCAKEGLALRGHLDSGRVNLNEGQKKGEGHFRALLKFRAEAGDTTLKNHLENASLNATYISWRIQNEIIYSMNSIILKKLVNLVNRVKYFSIIADETTDVGGKQQMSFCVRFFDREQNVLREEFLQFIPVENATGNGLAEIILKAIADFGLNGQNVVGQGYDGAAAMSGAFNGVQARICEQFPRALYVHCSAHCLNLAISFSCGVPSISNCMGTIDRVFRFFDFPKRQRALDEVIDKMNTCPRVSKLKRLCTTRWVERHTSVENFVELLEPLLEALDNITLWNDKSTSTEAQLLSNAICRFEFFINLHVLQKALKLSLPLSKYLQTVNLDLNLAVQTAMHLGETLEKMRDRAEDSFSAIFKSASESALLFEIAVTKPRTANRQTMRNNVPADSVEEYYRRSVYIPFLDAFVSSLNSKFIKHKNILQPFQHLLSSETGSIENAVSSLENLAEFYDLRSNSIQGEIKLWHQSLAMASVKPKSAVEAIPLCNHNLFPVISELLQIMATLPVTTCTAERSFSSLKILKTYLRNSTSDERLNGLALMYIHSNIPLTPEEVLDHLADKPRRLDINMRLK